MDSTDIYYVEKGTLGSFLIERYIYSQQDFLIPT